MNMTTRRPDPDASLPAHVAIILDGNRRWARLRGLPASVGHYHGLYKSLWPTVLEANRLGIGHMTLFGFSTENWSRRQTEVDYLFKLFETGIRRKLTTLQSANVRFRAIGQLERFPEPLRRIIAKAVEATAGNTGLTLTFALSYGGRQEILQAAQKLADRRVAEVTEELFSASLYDADLPDVDLLIRTSGEQRLSGFLPWQAAYAELYFTETPWPDFRPADLTAALRDFAGRKRRFGN